MINDHLPKGPLNFTVHFKPDKKSDDLTGLLSGFTKEEEYWWFPIQAGKDLWIFLNPRKVTMEQFFKKNPGFPPEHVHYVTQEGFDKFKEDLLKGTFFQSGKAMKVTGTVTITPTGKPKIPREKKQK